MKVIKLVLERERRETYQSQIGNLAVQMLPALDNLNRALDCAGTIGSDERDEVRQFFEGIVLVNQQVNDVLAGMGIKPIMSVGCEFDPHLHEAVATEETDEFPPNTIILELLRGYSVDDRIIRHSMVKVSTAGKSVDLEPEEDDDEDEEFDSPPSLEDAEDLEDVDE